MAALHPTGKERKAIRAQVREHLEYRYPQLPAIPHACGVGGTARAACKAANLFFNRPRDCRVLSARELHELLKQLKRPGRAELHLLLKTAPDRIHTLIPGMLVLDTLARAFQLEDITVSPCGVREGYLREHVLKEMPAHGQDH